VNKEAAVANLTEVMGKFTSYIGKRLPTDVTEKLGELRSPTAHREAETAKAHRG